MKASVVSMTVSGTYDRHLLQRLLLQQINGLKDDGDSDFRPHLLEPVSDVTATLGAELRPHCNATAVLASNAGPIHPKHLNNMRFNFNSLGSL